MKTSYDEALEIIGEQSTGNNNEGKVKDMFEYKALKKELEELKRDVKRYFDLGHIEEPSTEQFEEHLKLTEKLLKVGVKE